MKDSTDTDTPSLKVISGGRDKSETCKRSGKAPSGLTLKQEKFCQGCADGLSSTDSYRAAYDCSGMKPNVVNNEAWKLSARPDIAKRTAELIAEKASRNSMFTDKQREQHSTRVWRNVWRLAEGDNVPPAVQQSALALAAKMAGMLTDKLEVKQETADSKTIEAELIQRLQRLTG